MKKIVDLFDKSKRFCALPWLHIYGSVDGIWGRCCMDNSVHFDSEYRNTKPSEIALRQNTLGCIDSSEFSKSNPSSVKDINQAFNSPGLMKTRELMLKNKQLEACDACYRIEKNGGMSYRQKMNKLFKDWRDINWNDLINATTSSGYLDSKPIYIDIRFGNHCNLKCIMCNYPTSSKWGEDGSNLMHSNLIDPYIDNVNFWIDIENIVPNVTRIYFAGGEPFLQKGHLKLLELLVEKGLATNINLVYSTNLTYFPEKVINLLRQFMDVELGVSCDGTQSVFESIRVGANWEKFTNNLEIAKSLFKVTLLFTTQLENIFHITPFISWARNQNLPIDFTNILLYPENLSITKLKQSECKQVLWDLLSCKMDLLKVNANDYANQLQIIIDFLTTLEINNDFGE